ncbi:DUF1330 domain-containing protein [Gordonia rubripertincta]|uniref:DUF1330 domain-containing protein n=1 Tax=Gordonia rubripertincta TaxID=36822 RepID=A0ABT4MVN2_GORRU|nr:DUF1330 domain-containing protein [Gordonia rubripertincta]MCZ4551069.1 DUF1330 domain-containing protein [Gordonia rubripertincta]
MIQELKDRVGMTEYARAALPLVKEAEGTVTTFGLNFGESLMVQPLEGPPVDGVSVIEFPTREAFDEWYGSERYKQAMKIRQGASVVQAFVVASPPSPKSQE